MRPVSLLAIITALLSLSLPAAEPQPRVVVAFGDSLTAGYGLDPSEAWPAVIQTRLDERFGPGVWRVQNAGLSGETSSGGLRRISWILRGRVDVFILALGSNDGLRGQPVDLLEDNLTKIAAAVREKNPATRLVLAGARLPRNLGDTYVAAFEAVYPRVAEKTGAAFIPFLLEGVAADPSLNQADQIHPNAEGQRRVAATVWQTLLPVLDSDTLR